MNWQLIDHRSIFNLRNEKNISIKIKINDKIVRILVLKFLFIKRVIKQNSIIKIIIAVFSGKKTVINVIALINKKYKKSRLFY